jgi:5'/3'-nucleotidase
MAVGGPFAFYNSSMKLLLTNDDGIDAPGLQILVAVAQQLGEPIVAAPSGPQSGCSHRVTTDRPVKVEQRGEGRFAVHGTPADCVRVGLSGLAADAAWVLSGINHGGNLGADVHYSGTVAAVRESVLHGWPGIAVSHYRARGQEFDWDRAARWLLPLVRELVARPWERGTFWNINLPHPSPDQPDPNVTFCPLDPSPLPLDYVHEEGEFQYAVDYFNRPRVAGCDVDVCFSGSIAVTQVRLF